MTQSLNASVVVSLIVLLVGCAGSPRAPRVAFNAELPHPEGSAGPPVMLGGETTVEVTNQHAFAKSLSNLPIPRLRDFAYGNRIFNTGWVTAPASVDHFDGLGPLFNRNSCVGCHVRDGRGRAPQAGEERLLSSLVRVSIDGVGPRGGPLKHPIYGGQLQDKAIHPFPSEARVQVRYTTKVVRYPDGSERSLRKPDVSLLDFGYGDPDPPLLTSFRVASAVHGLGLLEAVPVELVLAAADPEDRDGDGISGRPNWVYDSEAGGPALGRFGWKAGQPTLRQQSAAAFAGDVGITSSVVSSDDRTAEQRARIDAPDGGSPELRSRDLNALVFYLRALAVPAARVGGAQQGAIARGYHHFKEVGCAACHRERLETASDAALPSLASQTIHPYTDLLLHDMGEELADGRPEFLADGREWRTAPLWGLGLIQAVNGHTELLHDGRARGPEEAILWHGGEAQASKEAFMALSASEREALLAFVMSL